MDPISINGRLIGTNYKPYVIAEMSANHNGSIDNAFKIIQAAKIAGADAVKLQTYTPDTITLNIRSKDFLIGSGLWAGKYLYDLYKEAYTPWEWHEDLFKFSRKLGITIFSTPFDFSAVDFLENLGAPAYKIASFEIIDIPLIKYVAGTGKPIIISTGMASLDEISEAVVAARESGARSIVLLRCVSSYPAPAHDYNINIIPDLIKKFNVVAGLSDHTLDSITAIGSVALGASVIEKHFTLDRSAGGPDDSFSLEPRDLSELCKSVNTVWESLGSTSYELKRSEVESILFRRSLYFAQNGSKGQVADPTLIRSVRPGNGLHPKYYYEIMGRKLSQDVEAGTALTWEHFQD
jgi:pseudaminic acid synthase